MYVRSALLAAGLLLFASQTVLAHGSMRPKHGGVVQMTGETLFELAGQPQGVSLYVEEEDEPVAAKAYSATLSITAGAKKQTVPMVAQGGNQFFAKGVKLPSGARVAAQVVNSATKARSGTTFIIK